MVVAISVVEFRHLPFAEGTAKSAEAAGPLGDGDGKHGFALLAQIGPFGDVAQAVKIDIGAAVDGDQSFVSKGVALNIFLQPRDRQCAGRLGDRAGVIIYVFDGGADFVDIYQQHFIDQLTCQSERLLADLTDRIDLDLGRGVRHHHLRFDAKLLRR